MTVGQRIRLITTPGRRDHRKIRRIAEAAPYYKVEDREGNTGMYRLDQMVLLSDD